MLYITNAFSLSMLPEWRLSADSPESTKLFITPIADPKAFIEKAINDGHTIQSAIGHADTAALFSSTLGISLPPNRISITLTENNIILVGQYKDPRLPEGTTTLPADAKILWLAVELLLDI